MNKKLNIALEAYITMHFDHMATIINRNALSMAKAIGCVQPNGLVLIPNGAEYDAIRNEFAKAKNFFDTVKSANKQFGYNPKAHHKALKAFMAEYYPDKHTMVFSTVQRLLNDESMIESPSEYKDAFIKKLREVLNDNTIID